MYINYITKEMSYKIFWHHALDNTLLDISISLPNTSTIKNFITKALQ